MSSLTTDTVLTHPSLGFLASKDLDVLQTYLQTGASAHKIQRFSEFLKALDWLPLSEISPNPLTAMPASLSSALRTAIKAYLAQKEESKAASRTKRQAYQQKITDYFKAQVSPQDKRLLEALRDYELEKTGQDRNWQHYFRFTSLKQIDAFCQGSQQERLDRIQAFKSDIDLFLANRQRLEDGTYGAFYWGFDDLLRLDEDINLSALAKPRTLDIPPEVQNAMAILAVTPQTGFETVRSQFRQAVHRHHPDRPGGNTERMRQAIAAYEVLKQYFHQPASQSVGVG